MDDDDAMYVLTSSGIGQHLGGSMWFDDPVEASSYAMKMGLYPFTVDRVVKGVKVDQD